MKSVYLKSALLLLAASAVARADTYYLTIAGLGAAFLALALLTVSGVAAIPVVIAVWATCVAVAVR